MQIKSISRAQLQSYAKEKDWQRVIELCQLVISAKARTDIKQYESYALLGRAWREQGDDAAAIAAYTHSLKQQPAQPQTNYELGLLYVRQKRYSRAVCHYQAALLQRPKWAQVAYRLGTLYRQLGQGDQAISTYRQILQHTPDHIESYFALGALYAQSGDKELAIKQYRQALFARPDSIKAYRHVGAALARLEEYAAAAAVYTQALSLFPENAVLYGNLGQMQLIQGETHQAMVAYHQSLALDPTLSLTHHNLGLLWRRHQDVDRAAGYFREALRLDPDDIGVLNSYANALFAQRDWVNFLDCCRLAIAQQSDWIESYCNKAVQLSDEDLLFRVQRTCGRFLMGLQQPESDATPTILKQRLAQIYQYMGAFSMACNAPERAEECYRVMLALEPAALEDLLEGYSELGKALMLQGRRAAAIAMYQAGILQAQQSLAEQPSDHESIEMVATLRAQLDSALICDPSDPTHHISGIYDRTQDWIAANATAIREVGSGIKPDLKCGGVTCQFCMGNLMRQFSPAQVGKQAYQCRPAAASCLPFDTFAVTIPQGRTWIAPQNNTWDICNEIATFTADGYLLGDLSRAFPWYLPGCKRHDIASHPVLRRATPLPTVQQVKGKVAVLSALSGHIYYHWMFDVLPRLNVLKQSLPQQGMTLSDVDYFVVNSLTKDFQKETLRALGVPLEKVIESDRIPHLQAEELVVPSFPGYLDWVPPESMDFLRSVFLPSGNLEDNAEKPAESKPKKRLYISRRKAKYRHLFNEAAVAELLDRFGFETVALETLSVVEQARLFAEAEAVVAPHGSGLTNLVFCSPDTVVIECFSPHYVRTDYWMISQYLRLKHYYLVGEGLTFYPLRQLMYPSGLTEDISVDVKALRSLLKTAGLNPL